MTSGKYRSLFAVCFSLLFAMSMFFTSFTEPVWAEKDNGAATPKKAYALSESSLSAGQMKGSDWHKDPQTFMKNFCLTPEQKQYTITECEKVVSEILTPEMSDLEKYYTLAVWTHKRVVYDWQFWNGGYDFDYYSHQWDSYGAMKEGEKSVCVGIAIFYSDLCHAADLPCRFVRLDPTGLDHTIDYIPDINGNAYYVDVTEDLFLMSEAANPFEPVDREFAHITKRCTDNTFNYLESDGEPNGVTSIKECYNKPYADWFKEYALHENTKKKFDTPYEEKGSGAPSFHRASYSGAARTPYDDNPDNLYNEEYSCYHEDFPDHSKTPGIWFLDDFYEDPAAIESKILNKKFDKDLLVVSGLNKNYDCNTKEELEAAIAQVLSAGYFPSSENGKIVAKTTDLTNGKDYNVTCTNFDLDAKTAELTITGKGAYSGNHQIQVRLHSAVAAREPVSKKDLVYNGKSQELVEPGEAVGGEMQYALGTEKEATEEFTTSVPTAVDAGKYYVWYKVAGDAAHESAQPQLIMPVASIARAANPITIKAETATVKYKKLKKKTQKLPVSKVLTVSKAEGEISYTLTTVKKGKKIIRNKISMNKKTGEVTVKKGLKKGTYKVKVIIMANGNANYEMSGYKVVQFKVRVN